LLADTDTFKARRLTVTLERLHNGPGRVASFWETGLEARLYDGDALNLIHHDASFLNPIAHFAFGYRHDDRFRAAGPLAKLGDPNRIFFRMAVSFNRLVARTGAEPSKITSFQLGVDYERGAPGSAIPGGLRVFLGGDFNALNLIPK
jgi:hypothetical protein